MLIKFTRGGRGSGATVAVYLTDPKRAGREETAPEVVRGDMARTAELIDTIDRKWSYSHGVLSFAPEDAPTEAEQKLAMDEFETFAFSGLEADEFDITWVRHQHTSGGRVELHFVTPRMELTTGKSLNIAPPGWEKSFARLRDSLNLRHGWARPDDPERARDLGFEYQAPWERDGFKLKEARETIHAHVTSLIEQGAIWDRLSMVEIFSSAGFSIGRHGKDYLTVVDDESGQRIRLKGAIYGKDWSYDATIGQEATAAIARADGPSGGVDRERADEAVRACQKERDRRAAWNRDHYRKHRQRDAERASQAEVDRLDYLARPGPELELEPDGLLAMALDATRTPAPRIQRVSEPRRELSDAADRVETIDLQRPERTRAGLPENGELSYGQTDEIRAGIAGPVQSYGLRIRAIAGRVRELFEEGRRVVEGYLREASRDRNRARSHDADYASAERTTERTVAAVERVADAIYGLKEERVELSLDYPDPRPPWTR